MKRWLLTILAVLSLVLFAMTCALWVNSYGRGNYSIQRERMPDEYAVVSESGMIFVWKGHEDRDGRRFNISNPTPLFAMPYVIPAVLGLVAPGAWVLRIFLVKRRRRLMAGCCVACGYDLRATPERCPECGMEAKMPIADRK